MHCSSISLTYVSCRPFPFLYVCLVCPEVSATTLAKQGDGRGAKETERHTKGMAKQESDDRPGEGGEGAEGKVLSKAELKRQRREKQVGFVQRWHSGSRSSEASGCHVCLVLEKYMQLHTYMVKKPFQCPMRI